MIFPQWTKKYSKSDGGRDFLSYLSVGVNMLEVLLPGISNITDRVRYYSFFSWVLYRYSKSGKPLKYSEFNKYLKIKSLAFLYANTLKYGDTNRSGVAGITIAKKEIDQPIYNWTDESIKNYRDSYWIYSRKMKQLDITRESSIKKMDHLVRPYGESLAEAYEDSIKNTKYFKQYCDVSDLHIPRDVLSSYGDFCGVIALKENIKEVNELREIIFKTSEIVKEGDDSFFGYINHFDVAAKPRRESLFLFLEIINQLDGKKFDYDEFQKIVYFSAIQSVGFDCPDKLKNNLNFWRMFQARQYFIYSLETIFSIVTKLTLDKNSIKIDQLIDEIFNLWQDSFNNFFPGKTFRLSKMTKLEELLKLFKNGKNSEEFDFSHLSQSLLSEDSIFVFINKHIKGNTYLDTAWPAVFLLILLYCRFSHYKEKNSIFWSFGKLGGRERLSMDEFFNNINLRVLSGSTVYEMLNWLIRDLVVLRHVNIATKKLSWYRNNTFHFDYSNGVLQGRRKAEPNINSPKFNNVINFLIDLDMVTGEDNIYHLTNQGRKMLKNI